MPRYSGQWYAPMSIYRTTIPLFVFIICNLAPAQQVDYLVTEYNQSNFQTGEATYVGMSSKPEWDWPSYSFFAAVDILTQSFGSVTLGGPSFTPALSIPWIGDGYEAYLPYASLEAMTTDIQSGTHVFNMDGLTENTSIPQYTPLTPRLVHNYTQLQAFDPGQDLTLSWEEFTEGQGSFPDGTPRGMIEVYIDYWDDIYGPQYAWSHYELGAAELNEFDALPATRTSVTIPAGTLVNSFYGYTVSLYFLKIDSLDDAVNATGALVVHLRTMDTLMEIWPKVEANPWINYPDMGNGWIDTGSWMGMLNVTHTPWVYSADSAKYLYIPNNGVSIGQGAWSWVPDTLGPQ